MNDKTVVIMGANGRFGLAAAQAFAAAGWRVLAQVRRAPDPAMPATVSLLRGDYHDTAALLQAVRTQAGGAAVLVHGLNPEYTNAAWRRDAEPMLQASMRLAQQLDALLMFPGSVYNYGDTMPPLLREVTPEHPSTEKGAMRCRMEAELEQAAGTGLRSVVMRAGDFFGGGGGSWFDQVIVKSLAKGRLVYPGSRQLVHAWAYLPDLGRACVAVAEQRALLPAYSTLHFPGHNITGDELLEQLEQAALRLGINGGRPLKREGFFWPLLRVAGAVVPMYRALAEMSYLWRVPHALSGERMERLIGSVPVTPLPQAMRASLELMGYGPQRQRA